MTALFVFLLFAQPVTDLGVMTPNRAVILEKCTNRTDFLHFTVELQAMRWPSNYIRIVTTNAILKMDDFAPMPPGPCAMAVMSTCADGEQSALSLFKLDIRRDPPVAPKAHMVSIHGSRFGNSLTNAFRALRERSAILPATPGQANDPTVLNFSPLPGGKPETYSEGVIKMQQFYAEHQGRRNQ